MVMVLLHHHHHNSDDPTHYTQLPTTNVQSVVTPTTPNENEHLDPEFANHQDVQSTQLSPQRA